VLYRPNGNISIGLFRSTFVDEVWKSKMIRAAESGLCNRIAFTEGWRKSGCKELETVNVTKCLSKPLHTAEGQGKHIAVSEKKIWLEGIGDCQCHTV
jgi:hypothetical protein